MSVSLPSDLACFALTEEEDVRTTRVATTPNSPHEVVPLGLLVALLHGWYYMGVVLKFEQPPPHDVSPHHPSQWALVGNTLV